MTVGLAGCSDASGDTPAGNGAGGDPASGDGPSTDVTTAPTSQPDASGAFACDDLTRGTQAFEPDDRAFQFVWDFPASFGDVERHMANTESMAGARLGHLASKQSAYWPFIIQIMQRVEPSDDGDITQSFVDSGVYEETTPIEYDGHTVDRAVHSIEGGHTWQLGIPGAVDGEYYTTTLILSVDTDEQYLACEDTAVAVAEGIMGSFRPNPAL